MDRLRTEAWTELRLACYARDNYYCRKCKKDKVLSTLHAHHIIPYIRGGKDELSNLLTLCARCHTQMENQYRRVGETRYLRDYIAENKKMEGKT